MYSTDSVIVENSPLVVFSSSACFRAGSSPDSFPSSRQSFAQTLSCPHQERVFFFRARAVIVVAVAVALDVWSPQVFDACVYTHNIRFAGSQLFFSTVTVVSNMFGGPKSASASDSIRKRRARTHIILFLVVALARICTHTHTLASARAHMRVRWRYTEQPVLGSITADGHLCMRAACRLYCIGSTPKIIAKC